MMQDWTLFQKKREEKEGEMIVERSSGPVSLRAPLEIASKVRPSSIGLILSMQKKIEPLIYVYRSPISYRSLGWVNGIIISLSCEL